MAKVCPLFDDVAVDIFMPSICSYLVVLSLLIYRRLVDRLGLLDLCDARLLPRENEPVQFMPGGRNVHHHLHHVGDFSTRILGKTGFLGYFMKMGEIEKMVPSAHQFTFNTSIFEDGKDSDPGPW